MCRILALRAASRLPLHRFLLAGDNSFAVQSLEHPDGWGLAYYEDGAPRLMRSVMPAICDELFEEISFSVRSETVLGHVRRATAGIVRQENCHPFQLGPWSFAHNGHIQGIETVRDEILELVHPPLREGIGGTTDSELYFRTFLSRLQDRGILEDPAPAPAMVHAALADAVRAIRSIADRRRVPGDDPSWLSCIATNGPLMIGLSDGKHLSVRHEQSARLGSHVLFSSEAIAAKGFAREDDAWSELEDDELVIVDADLSMTRATLF